MRYLLLICVGEVELDAAEQEAMGRDTEAWVQEMDGRGVRREGNRLARVSEARTVRRSGEELIVLDGPFAETKEQVAGYDLIECADLDEAIEIASKHPVARIGSIEIRPFWGE